MRNQPIDAIDRLVSSTDALLSELGVIGSEFGTDARAVREHQQRAELASIEESLERSHDGYVLFVVADDGMTCTADFYPPEGIGDALQMEHVVELLETQEIRAGIDWDAIDEALRRCEAEGVAVTDVVVARGSRPTPAVPAHIEINPDLLDSPRSSVPDGAVDHREQSRLTLVKEGDLLASVTEPIAGVMGWTVRGDAVPYTDTAVRSPSPGPNVRRERNAFVAACDGSFVRTVGGFKVNNVLIVESDVDYSTGHIRFPGDVVLRGHVKDGFRVEAEGSIFAENTLDATHIVCGGDLTCSRGVIGRGSGTLAVGGSVRARFLERCYLEAGSDIEIETSVLNSVIHTLGSVVTGSRGSIIGGRTFAANGVRTAQVGSASGPRTEIVCGLDYRVLHRLAWLRDKGIELVRWCRELSSRAQRSASAEARGRIETQLGKLVDARENVTRAAHAIVHELHRNEQATVDVTSTIYPGVSIEICNVTLTNNRELRRSRFRLAKDSGRVVSEPLPDVESTDV